MTTRAQRTTPHHVGTQPGMHPDDEPATTGDAPARPRRAQIPRGDARPLPLPAASARPSSSWGEHEDTRVDQGYDAYDGRPITSTRRFSGSEVPTVATPRNVIRVTHHRVPPRTHAEHQQQRSARSSEPSQRHQSPRPTPTHGTETTGRRPHYLGYVGGAGGDGNRVAPPVSASAVVADHAG